MRKTMSVVLAALMAAAALTACGSGAAETTAAETTAAATTAAETTAAETEAEETTAAETEAAAAAFEEGQKIDPMDFVTGPDGGGWAQIGAAIADKANEHFDGFPITATTGGSVANPAVMHTGEAQIGLSQGIFLSAALEGTDPYEEKMEDLRAVCSMESTLLYLVCDESVEANTIGELVESGKNVSIGTLPAGNAADMLMDLTLAEYGTTAEEISGTDVYVATGNELTDAYADHHFDLITLNRALPNSSLTELMTGRPSKILGIEEDVAKKLAEKYDWSIVTIPAGTYPGQDEDVLTVGMKSVLLVREDVPDSVAYFLAKTMYENKDYFETVQASYAGFDKDEMINNVVLDLHPGAEAYWKEVGLIK